MNVDTARKAWKTWGGPCSAFEYREKNEKEHLFKTINQIVISLESKNIINEENFSLNKIASLYRQGKSETFIKNTLIKKKLDKEIINKTLIDFEKNNPNWKIESAKKFANKKKLGRFEDIQNKEKDLAIMARAGFDYETAKKILGYDWLVFMVDFTFK